jgi:single-stranded-DNA-specific exonuclease
VDLLVRHGGHSAAAGFTVRNENLLALHTRLLEIAARELADKPLEPVLQIDAELNLRGIDRRTVEDVLTGRASRQQVCQGSQTDHGLQILDGLDRLRPFGSGNPAPVFASFGLEVKRKQPVGSDGRHLKMMLQDGRQVWDAIGFNLAGRSDEVGELVDVVYRLEINTWNGRQSLQLVIEDMRAAENMA